MQVGGTGMSSASLTAKVVLGCWKGLKLGHFGEDFQTLPPCFRCDEVCGSKRAPWLTRCPYLSRVTGFSLRHGDTYLPTSELLPTKRAGLFKQPGRGHVQGVLLHPESGLPLNL